MNEDEILAMVMSNPERANAILGLGKIPGQQKLLDQQMARADALRTAKMPGMRDMGRVAVAASPLEALGTVLQNRQGAQQVQEITGKHEGLLNTQVAGRMEYLKALGEQMRRGKARPQMPNLTLQPGPMVKKAMDDEDAQADEYEDAYYDRAGYPR